MKLADSLTRTEIEGYIKEYESYWKTPEGVKDKKTFEKIHKALSKNSLLTGKQLYEAAYWKSPRRSKVVRENPDTIVRRITGFALKTSDERYKIRLLCALKGIGIPRASAILAMSDPNRYGCVDIYAWYALTGKEKGSLDDDDWDWYLGQITTLAKKHKKTPREIDMALMKHGQKLLK